MTTEQKRIKIAEAVGIDADYFNDLNAMHEAEKTLTEDHWVAYCRILNGATCGCGNHCVCGYTVSATAAQRAEAFGLTLGLWEAT